MFGWRFLLSRRYMGATRQGGGVGLITVIAFSGIALSVATLIIVMSVMNGFRDVLLERILGINGHATIIVPEDFEGWPDVVARAARAEGVVRANALIEGQALFTGEGSRATGGVVRGLTGENLKAILAPFDGIAAGDLDDFDAERELVVGADLAGRLGVGVGDPLTVLSPDGPTTPFGQSPRRKTYRVGALFDVGMFEYDDNFVFMPLGEAQRFFSKGGGVDQIEIRVTDPDQVDRWRQPLRDAAFDTPHLVRTWRDQNSGYFNALATERAVMRLILSLIVAVSTLNIATGLVMLVKDKRRDIAILRTMGASKGAILQIFMTAGCLIGLAGAGAGLGLGALFVANINAIHDGLSAIAGRALFDPSVYLLSELPARMEPVETFGVVGLAFLMSALVTLYPSWRAARLDPVEALRYE